MTPATFFTSVQEEARRRRIPLKHLPQLDKGRDLTDGYWLYVRQGPDCFEMFHWERNVRTPVFETYDAAEAERLLLWHADTLARKAPAR
jgi:hypothetical protein